MNRRYLLILCAAFLAASCKHKLEGEKSPSVENADLTYCGAEEQSFVVKGAALSPMVVEGATKDASIKMPDVCLTRTEDAAGTPVSGEDETCVPPEDVQWVSQSEVRFTTRKRLGLAPGRYDVVIRNPDGTEAKGNVTLLVLAEGPQVFWSDPNVVYNGISTQVTLYGSLLTDVQSVALRDQDLELTELDFEQIGDPTRQNRVLATVPSGTAVLQDGYDVVVTTSTGCQAELPGGVTVTDTVDLVLTSVDPLFGWADQSTPVTITGEGFQAVPRAYLNPTDAEAVASALASVAVVSDTKLTGVVPPALEPGTYQLIVVNPDGRVGLLEETFTVTAEPPPVIASISPNYLGNGEDQVVTIEGSDFRAPSVSLACRDPDGADSTLEATVSADVAASSFQATLPVSSLTQGTVCVVKVTNSDGSYFEYSAVGIANPSLNLNPFIEAPAMSVARRAPSVIAGRATRAARFIYAIGGDDGTAGGALSSVESTPIDIYGEPAEWFTQPVALPAARTLSGVARIGRFLYLVGGNDGSAPSASVLRAEVLNPLAAPEIVDITARTAEAGGGLEDGDWYYRVSAVMADDDPSNPGGETLASDPIAVSLQGRADPLALTLYWDTIAGAQAYRIYRSPTGTETIDGVRLIAEVTADETSYEDTAAAADAERPPRPLGATGEWASLPDLGTAREAAGVAAAPDPADGSLWHLYAIGGRDAAALDSWERLDVTLADDGTQTVGAWVAGTAPISAPRAELTAYAVSHVEAIQVPAGTVYIYAGGGTPSSNVDVAEVAAGGDLAWTAADAMSPARSGYAGVAAAGFLFALGGAQAAPSDSNASARIDPLSVPDLENWNNEGVRLNTGRYLAGGTVESAFIYIVGGMTNDGPTASVERTVL